MVVQHNLRAMNSNRMLGLTASVQSKSTEKLSSGYKINRAADDAAGLSISEKMRKQIRGLSQASLNAEDGISAVQTAEGALNEVQDMLQRMNELAVKASNGTMSENDRNYIQNEIDQLTEEINRVAETTKFNETYLLKGDRGAEKVATFSYAEAMTVEFANGVSVLYAADGTEFKNAEALEEYLLNNKDAKVYTTEPTVTGDTAKGIKEVTIKKGAAALLPDTATTYTYDADAKTWTGATVTAANAPMVAEEETPETITDADFRKMFDIVGTPDDEATVRYTPGELATDADYTVTTPRGNTGNKEVGSLEDTDTDNTVKEEEEKEEEEATPNANLTSDMLEDILKGEDTTTKVYVKDGEDSYKEISVEDLKKDYADFTESSFSADSAKVEDFTVYKGYTLDAGGETGAFGDEATSEQIKEALEDAVSDSSVTLYKKVEEEVTSVELTYTPAEVAFKNDHSLEDLYYVNEADPETQATVAQTPMMAAAVPAADPVEPAKTFTEDAQYYDADGNKISTNALSNYIEFDAEEGSVKFKADARPIYADKDATTVVTNDDLKDDIMVDADALVGALELKLHVGADGTSNNQISIKLDVMSAKGLGVEGLKVNGADDSNALDAIETIKEAIQKVSTQRSALGAVQNRLEHTIANLDNVVENTTAAESQIRDTDMATEMVKYSNNNILAQAGQAMLAQANQSTRVYYPYLAN